MDLVEYNFKELKVHIFIEMRDLRAGKAGK